MQIDSGSDVNTITEDDFQRLRKDVSLVPTKARLYPYGSKIPLKLLGKFTASVSSKSVYDVADFYVVKGRSSSGSLLGCSTAVALGVFKIVNQVKETKSNKVDQLIGEFDEIFHGIGKMKGVKVKLHIDKT